MIRSHALPYLAFLAVVAGCAVPPYSQRDGVGTVAVENVARYGTIAGGGVGGYFAGRELGGSTASGVAGAAIGTGAVWGLHKVIDWLRGRAYANGVRDGESAARADLLRQKWNAAAQPSRTPAASPSIRRIFVPERTINGVEFAGGYQSVQVVYP